MKTNPLHDFNKGQIQLIIDCLRWDKLGKGGASIKMIEMVQRKVVSQGTTVELDGMEMKMIARGLMNKAHLLTAAHGITAKKQEKRMMYELANVVQSRRIKFQNDNHPLRHMKKAPTAGTVNAS